MSHLPPFSFMVLCRAPNGQRRCMAFTSQAVKSNARPLHHPQPNMSNALPCAKRLSPLEGCVIEVLNRLRRCPALAVDRLTSGTAEASGVRGNFLCSALPEDGADASTRYGADTAQIAALPCLMRPLSVEMRRECPLCCVQMPSRTIGRINTFLHRRYTWQHPSAMTTPRVAWSWQE